jgi:hypothetical protein
MYCTGGAAKVIDEDKGLRAFTSTGNNFTTFDRWALPKGIISDVDVKPCTDSNAQRLLQEINRVKTILSASWSNGQPVVSVTELLPSAEKSAASLSSFPGVFVGLFIALVL